MAALEDTHKNIESHYGRDTFIRCLMQPDSKLMHRELLATTAVCLSDPHYKPRRVFDSPTNTSTAT